MTPEEILAAISAEPELQVLVPDTTALAVALSAGRTRVEPRVGGIGLVLEAFGPEIGASVLDAVYDLRSSNPAVKWAWYLLERGELDFGSAATRGMVVELFADDAAVRDTLLSLALVPDPVSEFEVRCAIFSDTGEVLI